LGSEEHPVRGAEKTKGSKNSQAFRMTALPGTSRQADPARALVLFEDRFTAPAMTANGVPTPLLLSDGSAILEVLMLAQRLGVSLTP
jgi:hypothetical protein